MEHTDCNSQEGSREPFAEDFPETRFVWFGQDKLYITGGQGDDSLADQAGLSSRSTARPEGTDMTQGETKKVLDHGSNK